MLRRLLLTCALTLASLVLAGGSALAAPPVTETHHEKGLVETFIDIFPTCDESGPRYRVTTTANIVEHATLFEDGRAHVAFTQTGTFVAVPLRASLPTYRGHFTTRGGFNSNNQNANGTFTFSVRGTGTDGSRVNVHVVDHFNTTPTGAEFFFTHCHD
jgi:hypothetical protein